MVTLRTVSIFVIFMALIAGVGGHKDRHFQGRPGHHEYGHGHGREHGGADSSEEKPCANDPTEYNGLPPCKTPSNPSTTNEDNSASAIEGDINETNSTNISNNTDDSTSLERAHWCRLNNGTYFPLNYQFIHTTCSVCKCTKSRTFHCQPIQCMPTYCLDGSMPHRESGQCCTKCRSDNAVNATCFYDGINYPHGSILKNDIDEKQCWCQLGHIECRKYMGGLFDSLDVLASGIAVYLILMILFVILIFGSTCCCGITILYYYYYQNNQELFQNIYDEYINSAGWQPMEDNDDTLIDVNDNEKQIGAEKFLYDSGVAEGSPPAYGANENSYVSERNKQQ